MGLRIGGIHSLGKAGQAIDANNENILQTPVLQVRLHFWTIDHWALARSWLGAKVIAVRNANAHFDWQQFPLKETKSRFRYPVLARL